jgi:hypothetical protein
MGLSSNQEGVLLELRILLNGTPPVESEPALDRSGIVPRLAVAVAVEEVAGNVGHARRAEPGRSPRTGDQACLSDRHPGA